MDEPVKRLRNGEVVLQYIRRYPDPTATSTYDRSMTVVYTLDGAARAAFAEDGRLHGREPGSSRCHYEVSVGNDYIIQQTQLSRELTNIYSYSPVSAPQVWKPIREISNAEFKGYPGLQASDGLHACVFPAGVGLLDLAKERVIGVPNGLELQGPRPIQDGAVALRFGATQILLDFLNYDGTTTRLVTPEGARFAAGFALDRSQGDSLVWVEADGISPATNAVLFASPPARSAAQVVRRRVTAYDNPGGLDATRMIANNGYALILTNTKSAILVRLSDGAGWSIDAEPNTVFTKAMWVDDQDVWIATGIQPYLPRSEQVFEDGIVRFSRASLGAPNVAPR